MLANLHRALGLQRADFVAWLVAATFSVVVAPAAWAQEPAAPAASDAPVPRIGDLGQPVKIGFDDAEEDATLQTLGWTKLAGDDVLVTSQGGPSPRGSRTSDRRPAFGSFFAAYRYNELRRTPDESFAFAFDVQPSDSNAPGDSPIFLLSLADDGRFTGVAVNDQLGAIFLVSGNTGDVFSGLTIHQLATKMRVGSDWQSVQGQWLAERKLLVIKWSDHSGAQTQVVADLSAHPLDGPHFGLIGKFASTSYVDNIEIGPATPVEIDADHVVQPTLYVPIIQAVSSSTAAPNATVPAEPPLPPPLAKAVDGKDVVLYPPPSLPPSPQYAVQVEVDGEWVNTYVNFDPARTTGSGSSDEPNKTFSWTTFGTARPVNVRVTRLEGTFAECVVRPSRWNITPQPVDERTVEVQLLPGQKVSIEFDTEIKHNAYTGPPYGLSIVKDALVIFADALTESSLAGIPETAIYHVAPGEHCTQREVTGAPGQTAGACTLGDAEGHTVVVFEPGVHDIGYWQVPNGVEHIHFAGGAVVFGAIDVLPEGRQPFDDAATIDQIYRGGWKQETLRKTFRVTGPGILSGAKLPWHLKKDFSYVQQDDWWAHVKLLQLAVEQVEVRDVTLVNSPHWVLSFINDDDDRTHGTFDNFKMVGAWTYNNDGLPNPTGNASRISNAFIHADDDSIKLYNSGSRIDNVVIWQSNNGAAFQFGWFPKTVNDVVVSNVDVIHFENWYGVNQVNRAVFNYANSAGAGEISDITFNDVVVEGEILRLFGFRCGGGQVIRDITFNRLTSGGMTVGNLGDPGRNYLLGQITNWQFHDFLFGGKMVETPEEALMDFGDGGGDGFNFHGPAAEVAARRGQTKLSE